MSEYQYYEFLAVDRSLTGRQLEEVRGISSRAKLTSRSFVNEYHFGDFKGDRRTFLSKYYDLMVYHANWGTHRFMFGAPRDAVEPKLAREYCLQYSAEMHEAGEKVIFDLTSQDESGDWEEGGNWMVELAPVRDLVIGGDFRALYLGWLAGLPEGGVKPEKMEPAVPPGLGKLPPPLEALCEFLRVDRDLLQVAAQASAPLYERKEEGFRQWLTALPEEEKTRMLLELAEGEDSHAAAGFRRRFLRETAADRTGESRTPRRAVGQLLKEAERLREEREAREREAAEEKRAAAAVRKFKERAQHLNGVTRREGEIWKDVERLVQEKNSVSYGQAVALLVDLRDAAERSGGRSRFEGRIAELCRRHARKATFIDRVWKAGVGRG